MTAPARLAAFARSRLGVSAVEFALVSPVFCLILAGAVDFGGALYVKFNLDGAVTAAANYTLVNAASVNASGGATLASNLASLVASSTASNWANVSVVVNNGPSATRTGGVASTGGTAANADSCYCPTRSGATVTWGAAVACGSGCSGGGLAGRFVSIAANRPYTPFLPSFGVLANRAVTASTVVETY